MARAVPLLVALTALAIVFVVLLPGGDRTVGTDPPHLATPLDGAAPLDVVRGFTVALNDGDVEGALHRLHPNVASVFLPGLAGMATPTADEIREAFDRYQELNATLAIESCAESTIPLVVRTDQRTLSAGEDGGTVLDCSVTYSSSFGRTIGQPIAHLYMRFDVGDNGIAAMYLSPLFEIGD